MTTKTEVAWKSALRSLLPMLIAMGTYLWGQRNNLGNVGAIGGILLGMIGKGISAWLTARNVSLTVLP